MAEYDEEYEEYDEEEEDEECEEEIGIKLDDIDDEMIYNQLINLKDDILEELNLFVCTQSSKIVNFNYTMDTFTKKIKDDFIKMQQMRLMQEYIEERLDLPNFILSVNTNYEHFCQEGCEQELKLNSKKRKNNDHKKRQSQGDETIFHSAIQLNLLLDNTIDEYLEVNNHNKLIKKSARAKDIKIYKIKLYPSTGRIQIPGIIKPDLSDGIRLIDKLINYINAAPAAVINIEDPQQQLIGPQQCNDICAIEEINIIMINYKTTLRNISSRMLFNLNSIGEYIQLLEDRYLYEGMIELMPEIEYLLPVHKVNSFSKWNELVLPPFLISDTKLKNNDKYISFIFIPFSTEIGPKKGRIATVKIFQKGKINILGVKKQEHAEQIYDFLKKLIMLNIEQLIAIKLKPDVIET